MAYKSETLVKVCKALNVSIEGYKAMNPDSVKVCISKGNVKIGRVMNFSLAPVLTCGKACAVCAGYCYDIKACVQYPNTVVDARARNTALVLGGSASRDSLFSRLDVAMTRRRSHKYFRFHVAGDFVDMDYLKRCVDLVRKHPDFIVWTYTKQYDLVNAFCEKYGRDYIPSNFSIMFSRWDGLPMNNPYNFPEFVCRLKDGNVDTSDDWFARHFKCGGNCGYCLEHGVGCPYAMTAWVDEH